MSKVLFVDTKQEVTLAPGETKHLWWNNASPSNAVWSANAVPFATGSTLTGFSQDTQIEVTRLWRRYQVIEHAPSNSQISNTTEETEIHYEVKNIGGSVAKFHIALSAVYA